MDVTACQPSERTVVKGVSDPEEGSLCQRQYQGEDYQLCSVQEKPFTFSEQLRVQTGTGDTPQLMALRVQPVCGESKLIGGKLIFKGAVETDLLLQEPEGGLTVSHESLPFSQVMEVAGAGEDADCQVGVEVSAFQWEPVGDGRQADLTLELLAQAQVRRARPVTLLQDLYSTAYQMEADSQPQPLCRLVERSVRPQTVRELLETGELVRSVADSRLALGQVTQAREGNELVLTAEVWLTVLYLEEEEQVQCVRRTLSVTCRLECPEGAKCQCRCACPGEVFAAPAAGGVEARFTVEFHCLITQCKAVPMVTAARLGEPRGTGEGERPSVVLRLACPGESLWDIAKANGTTTDRILQANELEEDQPPLGRMLLIPSVR